MRGTRWLDDLQPGPHVVEPRGTWDWPAIATYAGIALVVLAFWGGVLWLIWRWAR